MQRNRQNNHTKKQRFSNLQTKYSLQFIDRNLNHTEIAESALIKGCSMKEIVSSISGAALSIHSCRFCSIISSLIRDCSVPEGTSGAFEIDDVEDTQLFRACISSCYAYNHHVGLLSSSYFSISESSVSQSPKSQEGTNHQIASRPKEGRVSLTNFSHSRFNGHNIFSCLSKGKLFIKTSTFAENSLNILFELRIGDYLEVRESNLVRNEHNKNDYSMIRLSYPNGHVDIMGSVLLENKFIAFANVPENVTLTGCWYMGNSFKEGMELPDSGGEVMTFSLEHLKDWKCQRIPPSLSIIFTLKRRLKVKNGIVVFVVVES